MLDRFSPNGPVFLKSGGFAVGTDAVLLYDFARICRGSSVADFGCGSGVIGILLARDDPSRRVTAVDLDPAAVEAAGRNAELNGVADRFRAVVGDLRSYREWCAAGCFDLVVMNPPYYPVGSGKLPTDPAAVSARSEATCALADSCEAARWAVRWGGRFCMVLKPERTAEMIWTMHGNGLEPKRLRFVHPAEGTSPSLVLAEAVRGAKPGMKIEPPLILLDRGGGESEELRSVYRRLAGNSGTEKEAEKR